MSKRPALLLAWLSALVAAGWFLVHIGHGRLAPPPTLSPAAIRQWSSSRDAATSAMGLLRLVSLIFDGYLLVTTVVGAAARAVRWASLVRVLDLVTLPSVRWLVSASLGGILLSAPLAAPTGVPDAWHLAAAAHVAASPRFAGTPTAIVPSPAAHGPPLVRVKPRAEPAPEPTTTTPVPAAAAAAGTGAATTAPPQPTTTTSASDLRGGVVPAPHERPNAAGPAVATWTVRRGDNFWEVASSVLRARTGEAPTPAQIVRYWSTLITSNEDRIASGNPNLIYPGERFIVPPP